MAIGIPFQIQSFVGANNSGSAVGSTGVDAPVGSVIVIALQSADFDANFTSFTDSAGNTYALEMSPVNGSYNCAAIAYCANTTHDLPIGSSFTAITSDAGQWYLQGGYAVSGANGGVDVTMSANGASATPSLSSGTLAQANEILFGLVQSADNVEQTFTESPGFTNLYGAGAGFSMMGYDTVSATTSVTYAPTLATPDAYGQVLVSFKAPSAPSSLLQPAQLLFM